MVESQNFLMVGNSFKSDVLPVLELEEMGFIFHKNTMGTRKY